MPMIKCDDLTPPVIAEAFDAAGHSVQIDSDDDVYVAGDDIEFPVWVGLQKDKTIRMITYFEVKEGVERSALLEFCNELNEAIVLPSFWCTRSDENRYRIWGSYFITTRLGVDTRAMVAAVRRFAGAMRAAGKMDKEDKIIE